MCCSLSHNLARATEIFIYETLHKQPERQEQLRSMTFRVSGSMGQINNAILEIASYANSVACDRQAPANEATSDEGATGLQWVLPKIFDEQGCSL